MLKQKQSWINIENVVTQRGGTVCEIRPFSVSIGTHCNFQYVRVLKLYYF